MFKSVGSGLQDAVVAEVVLRKALDAGLATPLPIRFDTKRWELRDARLHP